MLILVFLLFIWFLFVGVFDYLVSICLCFWLFGLYLVWCVCVFDYLVLIFVFVVYLVSTCLVYLCF